MYNRGWAEAKPSDYGNVEAARCILECPLRGPSRLFKVRLRANRLTRGRLALAALLLTVGQQHLLTAPADLLSLSFEARQHLKSVRNFISAVPMNVRGARRLFLWCAFKDPRELRLDHPIIVVCALGKKGCGVPGKIHRENAPCIA